MTPTPNWKRKKIGSGHGTGARLWVACLAVAVACGAGAAEPAVAGDASKALVRSKKATVVAAIDHGPVQVEAPVGLTVGKSWVMGLPEKALRISIANPDVADVMLVSPKEVYLLGKKTGTTNLFVWSAGGATSLRDVVVNVDTAALQSRTSETTSRIRES